MATTDFYVNVWGGTAPGPTLHTKTFTVAVDSVAAGDRVITDMQKRAAGLTLDWFRDNYLKLRFTGYAIQHLGYKVLPSTWRKKRGKASHGNPEAMLPNVFTTGTRQNVLANTRTVTNAVGGAASKMVTARMLPPKVWGGRNQITHKTINAVSADEAKRIADMYEQFMIALANSLQLTVTRTRKGEFRTRATMARDDQLAVLRSTRGRGRVSVVEFTGGSTAAVAGGP